MDRPCAPQGLAHAYVPHPAGCPKGKIQILHLGGGIPRDDGRRRRQSTTEWPERSNEIFTSVSPLKGKQENSIKSYALRASNDQKVQKRKLAVVPPYDREELFRRQPSVCAPATEGGSGSFVCWPARPANLQRRVIPLVVGWVRHLRQYRSSFGY